MKFFSLCLLLAAGGLPVFAQTDSATEAERTRIATERGRAAASFAAQELACYRKFAVADCLNAARAQRRERLSDLRRQELSLNDSERKRRSSERVTSIEEKNSAQKQEDGAAQRAEAVLRRREKEAELAQRAAERAQTQASAPARAARTRKQAGERTSSIHAAKQQRAHDTAGELRRYNERQHEAQEHRDKVAKRLAEPQRPEVKPLPVPP